MHAKAITLTPMSLDRQARRASWEYEVTDYRHKDYTQTLTITFDKGDYEITRAVYNEDTEEYEPEVISMSIGAFMKEHHIYDLDAQGMDITQRQQEMSLTPGKEVVMPKKIAKVHYATDEGKALCGMTVRVLETTTFRSDTTCKGCLEMLADMAEPEPEPEPAPVALTPGVVHFKRPAQAGSVPLPVCGAMALNDTLTTYVLLTTCGVCKGMQDRRVTVPEETTTTQEHTPMPRKTDPTHEATRVAIEQANDKLAQKPKSKAPVVPQVPAMPGMAPLGVSLEEQGDAAIALMEQALRETEKALAEARAKKAEAEAKQAEDFARSEAILLNNPKAPSAIAMPAIPLRTAEVNTKIDYILLMANKGRAALAEALRYHIIEVGAIPGMPQCRLIVPHVDKEPEPVVVPFDPLADSMASILEAATTWRKLGKDIPPSTGASAGKTPVETVKAIQQAWNNRHKKPVTQAELAVKYHMDEKKVWYYCNRYKQVA